MNDMLRTLAMIQNARIPPGAPKIVPGIKRTHGPSIHHENVLRKQDLLIIPDIHGAARSLHQTLCQSGVITPEGAWCGGSRQVVQLGDVLDRGQFSLAILDYLAELAGEARASGGNVQLLAGNHEVMALLATLDSVGEDLCLWLENGGIPVMREAIRLKHFGSQNAIVQACCEAFQAHTSTTNELSILKWAAGEILHPVSGLYASRLQNLNLVLQVDDVLCIHGGVSSAFAERLVTEGIQKINEEFRVAIRNADRSYLQQLQIISESRGGDARADQVGPLWFDIATDWQALEKTADRRFQMIGEALRTLGVNNVVVGHSVLHRDYESMRNWRRYGIKMFAIDVGVAEAEIEESRVRPAAFIVHTNGTIVNLQGKEFYRCLEDEIDHGPLAIRSDSTHYRSIVG